MSESYFFLLWPWKCLQLAGKNMRVNIDCLNFTSKCKLYGWTLKSPSGQTSIITVPDHSISYVMPQRCARSAFIHYWWVLTDREKFMGAGRYGISVQVHCAHS